MPFPKTWAEELIIEWLHLDSFVVEANLPVTALSRGGRCEVDVVGARVRDEKLEILHIETGLLAGGKGSIESVKNKFRKDIDDALAEHFKKRLSLSKADVKHDRLYVATFSTQPTIDGIENSGITVLNLLDFIKKRVLPTIKEWKKTPPTLSKNIGKIVTLPECHWLLQMLDYMWNKELLNYQDP